MSNSEFDDFDFDDCDEPTPLTGESRNGTVRHVTVVDGTKNYEDRDFVGDDSEAQCSEPYKILSKSDNSEQNAAESNNSEQNITEADENPQNETESENNAQEVTETDENQPKPEISDENLQNVAEADTQADIQADMQTDAQTDMQTDMQTDTQTDTQADMLTDTQADIQADMLTDTQTDTQAAEESGTNEAAEESKINEAGEEKEEKPRKITVGKIFGRIGICAATFILVFALALLGAVAIISTGKSKVVRDLFVMAMIETGEMDFVAHIFISDEEINKILAEHEIVVPHGNTNTSLIEIGGGDDGEDKPGDEKFDINKLEIVDITGKTFKGKMMIVNDPSRVTVGTPPAYGEKCVGITTLKMAEPDNIIGAINGGGYVDKASNKTGGLPLGRNEDGIVIAGGKLRYGDMNTTYEIIGLDKNGILHVDNMTPKKALEIGIRDAVNWGPILVKNGEPCVVPSDSANVGFHPRSAIGQRKDGAILLLVIDGRQANSLGASYDDIIEIMVKYGAVNAANLDGGMSSYMVYEHEIITEPYLLYAPRNVSTSWLVSRVKE